VTAPKPREATSPGSINPLMPQPLDPSRTVKKTGGKQKPPNPLLAPPVLVTAGLLVLLAEVGLWVAVGWLWWLAANVAAVALLFSAALAWRRRSKDGLLDRLFGSRGSGKSGTARSGGRSGRSGGLGRLFGGGSGKSGGGSGGAAGGSGRRGGLLSRLFGDRSGGAGSGGSGAAGSAGGKRGGGLLSRLRGRTRSGGSGSAGGGRKSGGLLSKLRGAGKGRSAGGGKTGGTPTGGKSTKGLLPRVGKDFAKGVREGADRTTGRKPDPKVDAKTGSKNSSADDKKLKRAADVKADQDAPGDQPERKPSPRPRPGKVTAQEETMVQHEDDASLQKWGRNLKTVGPAIEDLAKKDDQQVAFGAAIAASVRKLAVQGDSDLPADKTLVAEVDSIAAELRAIQAEREAQTQRLRGLAARAETLGGTYSRQHDVDEARLAGERGGRHREKRADVGTAEQDT
jgi:hypothetical protein